jgi:hypothetical protein
MTNKRDVVLSVIDTGQKPNYIPAAFFLHFDPQHHRGQAAVDRHLEYFHYTNMDFVKIHMSTAIPGTPPSSTHRIGRMCHITIWIFMKSHCVWLKGW